MNLTAQARTISELYNFFLNKNFVFYRSESLFYRAGVTNVVPADTRSPARTIYVARGPVLKITLG